MILLVASCTCEGRGAWHSRHFEEYSASFVVHSPNLSDPTENDTFTFHTPLSLSLAHSQ